MDRSDRPSGHLYLIPSPLGSSVENLVLPEHVIRVIHSLDTFFAERIRQANSFLRWLNHPVPDYQCRFYELNKHTPAEDLLEMLGLLKQGARAGIISEAGCPAIADPGSSLVRMAHDAAITVTPLVGPSSILLALMASGMNGQSFTFHGYLPKQVQERTEQIRQLLKESIQKNTTQVFMETPFRNNDLLKALIEELPGSTLLCTASNLTLSNEEIITKRISDWKMKSPDLKNAPTIFLFQANDDTTQKGRLVSKKHISRSENKKPARKHKRVRK
ncbi:MAG: SAM-dependent methyltransferase [Balneolales bacterium]